MALNSEAKTIIARIIVEVGSADLSRQLPDWIEAEEAQAYAQQLISEPGYHGREIDRIMIQDVQSHREIVMMERVSITSPTRGEPARIADV